jgi:hypothetical protein
MKKTTKRVVSILSVLVMATSFLTACGEEEEVVVDTALIELQQSDYRGGIKRTSALKSTILNIVESMKVNNDIVRQDSPNSFWTTDGYQDFVSTLLDTSIINDTQWFNEEEREWSETYEQIATSASSFTKESDGAYSLKSGISIVRNEKDDYAVTGTTNSLTFIIDGLSQSFSGSSDYRILYDCDKDWCKAYSIMNIDNSLPRVTAELFEYQRVDDNTFAIQTSKERLLVILDPVDTDTDIRERTISKFYYSKLVSNGQRTTYDPYEPLPATDENGKQIRENVTQNTLYEEKYPFVNLSGDLSVRYGVSDSMFYLSPQDMTTDWVFEDKALQQGIVYDNGILIITTYNKLSTQYERFIYTRADADISNLTALEDLVVIKDLVGVQEIESVAVEETSESTTETTTQPAPAANTTETTTEAVTEAVTAETTTK